MLDKVQGGLRAALRKRTTYLVLMLLVTIVVLVPVVREPSALTKASEDVPELHALIYALQRTKPGETLPATLNLASGAPVKAKDWADAAGEQDMAVWRASARRALQSHPVVVRTARARCASASTNRPAGGRAQVFSKTYCP